MIAAAAENPADRDRNSRKLTRSAYRKHPSPRTTAIQIPVVVEKAQPMIERREDVEIKTKPRGQFDVGEKLR